MERDYSPYFPEDSNTSFSPIGLKFKSNVSTDYTTQDVYGTRELAEERAYNIGCSGYRRVLINAKGLYNYAPCSSQTDYYDIMKWMIPNTRARDYYAFDPTDNLIDVRDSVNDKVKEGFDYKENIFKKTMSNVIFRDPVKSSILKEMQRIIFALIESVKQIRNSFNYTVPKNNKRVF